MAREALSHSQSLRVIGQRLHGTGIDAFELIKKGNAYYVRIAANSAGGIRSTGKFAPDNNSRNDAGGDSLSFKFTRAEIRCYDDQEKLKRNRPSVLPDIGQLSVALRVLGDYLDRHAAEDFAILWSEFLVKVCCGDNEHVFTAQNLYDLGIVMYLRSANPAPRKSLPAGRADATRWPLLESRTWNPLNA